MATEDGSEKKENFFKEKLLAPIIATAIAGLIATYISNYLAKQNYYDDVVEKYTTKLREFVISDKLNYLREETKQLNDDIDSLEKLNKSAVENSNVNLSGLLISKKLLVEEALLTKNEGDSLPSVKKERIQELLKFIRNYKDEKDKELSQIRGLMNTATVNTLITLSDNDAFFPLFSLSSWLSNIPGFYGQNIKRRDILINALRLSELGIGNRDDGTARFDRVLNGMIIGGYSLQSNAKIDLQRIDLSLAFLNDSKFTDVNLESANFNHAKLRNSLFSQSNLNGVNFSGADMKNVQFINSSLHNSKFDGADLSELRATSNSSNRICYNTFLFIFQKEDKGFLCNRVDFSGSSFREVKGIKESKPIDFNPDIMTCVLNGATHNWKNDSSQNDEFLNKQSCSDLLRGSSVKQILSALFAKKENGVSLENANLTNTDFTDSNLRNASFKNANLSGADFTNADLRGADFTNANLSNIKGLDLVGVNNQVSWKKLEKTGAKFCNTTYNSNSFLPNTFKLFLNCQKADLSGQDLSNLGVGGIGFNLAGIDLRDADLTNANLFNAVGIDLSQLMIMRVKLCNTTLPNSQKEKVFVNCIGADLSNKDLSGTDLSGINLTNTNLTKTNLTRVNLARTRGITLSKLKSFQAVLCKTQLPGGEIRNDNCSFD